MTSKKEDDNKNDSDDEESIYEFVAPDGSRFKNFEDLSMYQQIQYIFKHPNQFNWKKENGPLPGGYFDGTPEDTKKQSTDQEIKKST